MTQKIRHFMDEADIGSGEKTASEQEDLEQTSHLKEQQEQARQQSHPLDGSQLQQVVEEQQYISEHENHLPPGDEQPRQAPAPAPVARQQRKRQSSKNRA